MSKEDPVCPECAEPVGITAAYCMHCSADLTDDATGSSGTAEGKEGAERENLWSNRTDADQAVAGVPDADAADGTQSGVAQTGPNETETATHGDLPPELRSTSGSLEPPRLVPEQFLLKALGAVLSIVLSLALGFASAVALSSMIGNGIAFLLGVLVWFSLAAVCFRLAPF